MKHKIYISICIILIILTIGLLWSNSLKTVEQSNKDSDAVKNRIQTAVNNSTQSTVNISSLKVRKTAHAVEFFALGIELSALSFILKKRFLPQSMWNILSSALAVAVVDESIQIWSGRGSQVSDVLIDFSGALIGFLLALLVRFIITSCKKGKRKNVRN